LASSHAAVADRAGDDQLDGVDALGRLGPDLGADFVGGLVEAGGVGERVAGGEQPWAGQPAAVDRVAHRDVDVRADALDGGEAAHQHDVGVLRRVHRRLGRGLVAAAGGLPVLAEVDADVDVAVDQPGQHGHLAEVVGDRTRVAGLHLDDLRAVDGEGDVAGDPALAVEQFARPDGDRLGGGARGCGRPREAGQERRRQLADGHVVSPFSIEPARSPGDRSAPRTVGFAPRQRTAPHTPRDPDPTLAVHGRWP